MNTSEPSSPKGSATTLLKTKLFREGLWVTGGQIASVLATLVSIRILTELLRPEAFGRLNLLMGVAALALGIAATPWLQALIRYYPEWHAAGRVAALRHAVTGLVTGAVALSCLVIAGGWGIAEFVSEEKWWVGLLVVALLLADVVRSFELALFNAARRQRVAAVIQVADAWSRPLFAVLTVMVLGASAEAAMVGYVIASSLVVLALRWLTRLEGRGGREAAGLGEASSDAGSLMATLKRYSLPLLPLAVFGWINGMGDRYVIGGFLGIREVGLYAAAYGLASRPFLMTSGIIEQTLRPVLQNAIASGDLVRVENVKRGMLFSIGGTAALGVLCFVLLKDVAAWLLLAEDYRVAAGLMPWIALGYAFYTVSNVYSRFCYAFDATVSVLVLTAAGAIIGMAVLVPAVMFYGLAGAVIAVPVRFGIELVLSFTLARKAERGYMERLGRGAYAAD